MHPTSNIRGADHRRQRGDGGGVRHPPDIAVQICDAAPECLCANRLLLTAHARAMAAWLWSGRNAMLAGYSAAAVLGSKWLPDDAPAELARIRQPSPPWILIHTGVLAADELHLLRHRPTGIPGVTRMDDRAGQRPSTAVPAARDRRSGAQRLKALTPKLRVVTDSKRNPSETVVSA